MTQDKIRKIAVGGFSFIELLVVISIIMVLSGAGVVKYKSVSVSSRDTRRKLDVESIRSALEICRTEDGRYPASVSSGTALLCFGGTQVMSSVPSDPDGTGVYKYVYTLGPSPFVTYTIVYTLESGGSQTVGQP